MRVQTVSTWKDLGQGLGGGGQFIAQSADRYPFMRVMPATVLCCLSSYMHTKSRQDIYPVTL